MTARDHLDGQETPGWLQAVAHGDTERVVAVAVQACGDGARAVSVAADLLRFIATAVGPWPRVAIAIGHAVRASQHAEGRHRALPIAHVAALACELLRWPAGVAQQSAPRSDDNTSELVTQVLARAERASYFAPLAEALAELAETCGEDAVAGLVHRSLEQLAASGQDEAPGLAEHLARIDLLTEQWQRLYDAADPAKAAKFQEPKFRRHLLDGGAETAFRAMAKALAYGVPRELLIASVGLAAAERALRFDAEIADDSRRLEGWSDAVHSFELAAATVRLLRRADRPQWLRLLLSATWLVSAQTVLDAPVRRRFEVPEPEAIGQTWDHGPEIAKLRARLLRADCGPAIAVLRGYLLMVLPVQPLCDQLALAAWDDLAPTPRAQALAATSLASGVEIFSALGEHPHRELALCAAIRLASAPLAPRRAHRAGLQAVDIADGIPAPKSLSPRLWTSLL